MSRKEGAGVWLWGVEEEAGVWAHVQKVELQKVELQRMTKGRITRNNKR